MPQCQSSEYTGRRALHGASGPLQPGARRRRWLRAAGYTVCATLLQAAPALAESRETGDSGKCTRGRSNALSEVACELNHQLALSRQALVVSAPPRADARLSDRSRLAGRIAMVVAAGLGGLARAHEQEATLGAAQLAAAKHGALVYLEPEIEDGKLRVTANLFPIARSFWDRVRDPHPSPIAHGFAERGLDPELRSFFARIPLVAKETTLATPPEREPVALACGDADDDGSPEVAFVGRRRISLGRFRAGRFHAIAERNWSELSAVAPAPLRVPLAAARVTPGTGVDVGSSDRARFVSLDPALRAASWAPRRIPFGEACLEIEGHQLGQRVLPCLPEDAPPQKLESPAPAEVVASTVLLDSSGQLTNYFASYRADDTSIGVHARGALLARLEGAGAQLALGDLDGDGRLELLSSLPTLDASEDALLVHTLTDDAKLLPRLRIGVPDGITAITSCTPGTASMGPIVVGTRARVWIIQ